MRLCGPTDLDQAFRDGAVIGVSEDVGDLGLAGHSALEQHDDLPVPSVQHREKVAGD